MLTATERDLAELVARYHDDPGGFNTVILGGPPFWWRQEEMARSVVTQPITVAESGNVVGKSWAIARIILWWMLTRANPLVVLTAPSQALVGTVVFKELRKAHRMSRIPLGGKITDSPKASPQTLILPDGATALGFATKGVERLSGQHNPEMLGIVEEASGVDDAIWEAVHSWKAKRLLVCGNPLRADGEFVKLAERGEREANDASIPARSKVRTITIPSTDSPDIHLEESPRGLADATFIANSRRQYGEDSLWYRCHIKAIRPTCSHDRLIEPAWFDACLGRARSEDHAWGVRRLGCDLGEGVGRDKTVMVVRDDLGIRRWTASHGMGVEASAKEMDRLIRLESLRQDHCTYDALGIGRDLPLYLEPLGLTECLGYKGSFSGGPDFANLRSAAAWAMRNAFDPGRPGHVPFSIPDDEHGRRLREEVLALRYDLDGKSKKTRLEPKEDLTARLGHSPDYADALIQTYWAGANLDGRS
jgi:phage terminase large subunit